MYFNNSDDEGTGQDYTLSRRCGGGVECDRVVELPPLSASPHLDTALFMMETSGGSTLTPRQACGVESAARKVAVILITIYCSNNIKLLSPSLVSTCTCW